METREITCIGCPLGCAITVKMDGERVLEVRGNSCRRGEDYAVKEMTDPRRTVTTTVRVSGGKMPVVPVRTAGDIPKDSIFTCVSQLKDILVCAPVRIGDIILENAAGSGVRVIAAKDCPLKKCS